MFRSLLSSNSVIASIGLLVILALAACVYWPALSGGFLFDDWSNLPLLGMFGVIDNQESLLLYLLSGFSGPTGRPLSHLSFLLDARDWPAAPEAFKRTNLVIHLLVGVVLFGLMSQLTKALGIAEKRAIKVALLATALWVLHPFWVSTTMYVVQRMTQLSALFVLSGLWLYVWARLRFAPTLSVAPVMLMALGIGLFGLLAVLSKENGVLLPVLAITLELTVLGRYDRAHGRQASRAFAAYRGLLLGLPALAILIYMVLALGTLISGDAGFRDFTPAERLLTQGRILWDYLFNILVPLPYPGGLFNDDIVVSSGLFAPWHTAVAWIGWVAITVWAFMARKHHPALALAVLFFLAGHLLESTWFQLELYFEHRNYLPAALISLPIALWLIREDDASERHFWRNGMIFGLLAVLCLFTFMRANLWGTPFQQALKWAHTQPESPRAQNYLAGFWRESGHEQEASRLNLRAIELDPTGLPWLIEAADMRCGQGKSPNAELAQIESVLAKKPHSASIATHQLAQLIDHLLEEHCKQFDIAATKAFIGRLKLSDWAASTPSFQVMLMQREARAWLLQDKPKQAFEVLRQSLGLNPDEGVRLTDVATLASAGHAELALRLLDAPLPTPASSGWSLNRLRQLYLDHIQYYSREREHLRSVLVQETSCPSCDTPSN